MPEVVTNRFRQHGRYSQAEMIRDLILLVEQVNAALGEQVTLNESLQDQIDVLKQRIDDGGIP